MLATRLAVICAGSLALAGAAWVFWKPSTATPFASNTNSPTTLVSPHTPTTFAIAASPSAQSSSTATPLAGAHSTKAIFEESRDCYFAQNQVYAMNSVINACQTLPQTPETESQRAACSSHIEMSRSQIRELSDAVDTCPKGMTTAKFFYEATKAAAARGEAEAQACYVQSLYQSDGVDLTYSQQDIDDYRRDAPRYIAEGLSRGDWRIVSLLARGGHGDQYSPLSLITKDDIYTQYVMNRLLQLGADGSYAAQLDRLIQSIYLAPRLAQGPPLTQEQVAQGSKDALDLFHRSFDRRALLQGPPLICVRK